MHKLLRLRSGCTQGCRISNKSQNYSNVTKKVKHKSPWMYMCSNLPSNHATKKNTLKTSTPLLLIVPNVSVPSAGFAYYFSTYLKTTLQCILLKRYKDMNYWTHSSSWRLWFTCNAPANSWAPMFEMWFLLRLQNFREQEMRGGSTNLFTLCKVYYFGLRTSPETLWECSSVSGVEDYKHITMTTCRNEQHWSAEPSCRLDDKCLCLS